MKNKLIIDFIQIPLSIVQNDKIRDIDKLIYGVILYISKWEIGKCIASNKTISEFLEVSDSTVAHGILRLKDANLITIENPSPRKRFITPNILLQSVNVAQTYNDISSNVQSKPENSCTNIQTNNNIYINNNIYNNIISELYKINNKIYLIGKTKLQKQYLDALLKCPPNYKEGDDAFVEHVEHIIQWYVSEYIRLEQLNNDEWKFLPKATVPSKLVEKWNRIEQLYNESHKEHKSLW